MPHKLAARLVAKFRTMSSKIDGTMLPRQSEESDKRRYEQITETRDSGEIVDHFLLKSMG